MGSSGQGWATLGTDSVVARAFLSSSLLLCSTSYISHSFWEISARMIPWYYLPCPGASTSARNFFLSWISLPSSSNSSISGAGFSACTGGAFFSVSMCPSLWQVPWSLHSPLDLPRGALRSQGCEWPAGSSARIPFLCSLPPPSPGTPWDGQEQGLHFSLSKFLKA